MSSWSIKREERVNHDDEWTTSHSRREGLGVCVRDSWRIRCTPLRKGMAGLGETTGSQVREDLEEEKREKSSAHKTIVLCCKRGSQRNGSAGWKEEEAGILSLFLCDLLSIEAVESPILSDWTHLLERDDKTFFQELITHWSHSKCHTDDHPLPGHWKNDKFSLSLVLQSLGFRFSVGHHFLGEKEKDEAKSHKCQPVNRLPDPDGHRIPEYVLCTYTFRVSCMFVASSDFSLFSSS